MERSFYFYDSEGYNFISLCMKMCSLPVSWSVHSGRVNFPRVADGAAWSIFFLLSGIRGRPWHRCHSLIWINDSWRRGQKLQKHPSAWRGTQRYRCWIRFSTWRTVMGGEWRCAGRDVNERKTKSQRIHSERNMHCALNCSRSRANQVSRTLLKMVPPTELKESPETPLQEVSEAPGL